MLHHVPTAVAQDAIFAELGRVLRPGGVLVAADAVYSEDLLEFHEGDTYNPIDPDGLAARLRAAAFERIEIDRFDFGWMCAGVRARADATQPRPEPGLLVLRTR